MGSSKSVYDFTAKTINGESISLSQFRGKPLVIVNVASQCGFTPQYKGLQELFDEFKGKGFTVLGFPCNQFGSQEPGTEKEIQSFCETSFGVTFPMFAKVDVNGPNTDPLWTFLKESQPGLLGTEAIKWNFTKFLVDKNGQVVKRFAPKDSPESMKSAIASLV